jgi:hypothetical protein
LFTTLAVSPVYPVVIEPRWLDVSHRTVPIKGIRSPVRILHLSDLHASFFVSMSMILHAISLGLEQKPDLICLTGDYITRGDDLVPSDYAQVLQRLSKAAPTYAVLGNHDGGAWAQMFSGLPDHKNIDRLLEVSGIQLLHNRSTALTVRDTTLSLVGTGDLWNEELDAPQAFSEVGPDPVVLLSHNPDGKDMMAAYPWQLMLSGHTHGGQVIIPFLGTRYAPVQDKRYVSGLRAWGTRQIHVSRGVGNVGGVRFACRPEVTLLELVTG